MIPDEHPIDIPSQNAFLVPFLRALSTRHSLTRAEIITHLLAEFRLPERALNIKQGNLSIILNRVGWCDTHFVKAGMVIKEQHPTDSQQDRFRITPLGLRELSQHADQITVGYLQGFYLGKVIRGAKADDSTSEAERTLYEAFEQLGDDWTIIQGVSWISKDNATVGEIDFLIAHPKHGVLVMEVKGGIIAVQNGNWTSTNLYQKVVSIQDPCIQAERNRRELKKWLALSPKTRQHRYAIFPALAFPDSQFNADVRPDCPQDIILDIRHLENIEARLLAIFAHWQSRADKDNRHMDGRKAVEALLSLFQVTQSFQPAIVEIFKRENKQIDRLTQSQFKILRQLHRIRRAAIMGGAGTGKTLLAMEKAHHLLTDGFRVLVMCYNRNLQTWLELKLVHEGLVVSTFHSMVEKARQWAGFQDTPMSIQEFDAKAPDLLLDACHVLRQIRPDKLFDAIIIDEAQDFQDTWWIALSDLLKDPQNGIFYVFFDENQRLYARSSTIPMADMPFVLNENCRNTQHIHHAMNAYAQSDILTECIGPEGRAIDIRNTGDPQKDLQRVLHELINEQGVKSDDIIILTPASKERSQWKHLLRLGNFALTWDLNNDVSAWVRVSTIYSYKGLESSVVILTELDKAKDEVRDILIYVGISRAKNHVIVIGDLPPARR
jgi:DNA-binding MarR family transcriptional regulator